MGNSIHSLVSAIAVHKIVEGTWLTYYQTAPYQTSQERLESHSELMAVQQSLKH